ncbi:MAG: monofunctional biosynthetic peptidoglycan transglycosylase [Desulfobacterales bacterium]|nr:monofunctional biosynthetic peptidoglycan transglycosylase [Desulfobacterales bacterium]
MKKKRPISKQEIDNPISGRPYIKIGFYLFVLLFGITIFQVLLFRYINPPTTLYIAQEWFVNKLKGKPYKPPDYRWRDLSQISPHLRKSVLAAEDQRFLNHRGFDFIELKDAILDIVDQKRIRGASTISMQTARTLYLFPSRNFVRKFFEAYYTVLIELFWDKKRILEIYLNTVDWGRGVMGAEAASIRYFNTSATNLTIDQSALLAAILPNPHVLSPRKPTKKLIETKIRIMNTIHLMPLL